jgi:hypothetical protein
MLGRWMQQVVHTWGNGRAVENARRGAERERFAYARIDAIGGRIAAAAPQARPGRSAA